MEQIVAQTQAELEQEGWVFQSDDVPPTYEGLYRLVLSENGDVTAVTGLRGADDTFEIYRYLVSFVRSRGHVSNVIPIQVQIVLSNGTILTPVRIEYTDDEGAGVDYLEFIASYRDYYNGIVDNEFIVTVSWSQLGGGLSKCHVDVEPVEVEPEVASVVVWADGSYTGDLVRFLQRVNSDFASGPWEMHVWNRPETVVYKMNRVYFRDENSWSFYATYERGGALSTVEVEIDPFTAEIVKVSI